MFHKRLMKEFKENRNMTAGMVAAQWIMLLANAVLLLETAVFTAAAFRNEAAAEKAVRLAGILVFVLVVRGCMSYMNSRLSFEASRRVKSRLRDMIYEKLMCLGSGCRERLKTSEAVQISTEGVEQLEIYFGKYIPQFFYSMLAPVTLFIIVGSMSLRVAAVLLICVPLIPVSIIAVQKFARKLLAKYWGTYTELGDSFLECLQGLTTLKIYQADGRYADKMDAEAEKFRKATMRVLIMQLNSISIMDLVAYGGAAAGIVLSILEFRNGQVSLEQCFFMIMISAEFFLPLRLLGSFFHIAMNGNAAADKIFHLMDTEEYEGGTVKNSKDSTITFDRVSFAYGPDQKVLEQISLEAGTGLTALVGESGCGKSTAASLMAGELRPAEGSVCLGGLELTSYEQAALRRKITRIRHNSYLFAGTVRENLKMGRETAAEDEMYRVLKLVNMLDYVEEQGGLDMEILEKAANLSGGQKQRLCLARALLHDSDIYIFDEASSNVDVQSETDIMAVVRALARDKTVILISHRLTNITDADRIYVMKQGGIIEAGTHGQLCRQRGYYYALFEKQTDLERYGKEMTVYE